MSENKKYIQHNGYRIYLSSVSPVACQNCFIQTTLEICHLFFQNHTSLLIENYGMDTTKMIFDHSQRSQIIPNFEFQNKEKNSRNEKIMKKSGKTNLFLSPQIMTIRKDKTIYSILTDIYKNDKLAFTNGLDHIIYKVKGSEEYPPTLDCKINQNLEDFNGLNNPFHYSCMVCISSSKGQSSGKMSLLENFDYHFDFIKTLVDNRGKFPLEKQKKDADYTVLDNLNIELVNQEISKKYFGIKDIRLLKWVEIDLNPGDVLIFDCRIPYKIEKNDIDIPVMYIPISLRPVPQNWYKSRKHSNLVNAIKNGKVGDWNKKTFKGSNIDEYRWRTQQNYLDFAKLENCINNLKFEDGEQFIFGLKQYELSKYEH